MPHRMLCLVLLSACAFAQDVPNSKLLVSTAWLADHLNDPKVVILEVDHDMGGMDMGPAKHIPGARRADLNQIQVKANGLEVELPPDATLKDIFEKLGVSDDTRVVLYSSMWMPMITRVFYTLDYMGHDNVALLDGSVQNWIKEKRPTVAEYATAPAAGHITLNLRPQVRAMLAEVKAISADRNSSTALLDARPADRYKRGHIAGAQNLFSEDTVADAKNNPTFKSPEELRKMLAARGIKPGQRIVAYCEIGYWATLDYFVAKYLGYPVAMYDGSMNEWDDTAKLPLVKGPSPR
jgi:thiosulfate/3-mercaptopyruvate sulfurtransferase